MKVGTSDLLQIYARLGSPKSTAQYFRHFAATSNDSLIPTRNIFLICSGNRHFHASVIYKSTQIPSSINNRSFIQQSTELAAAEPYFHAL